jgi:hypothetical protein
MANNAQKTPLVNSLNRFAEQKAADAIQVLGRALPCSVTAVNGAIVTVKFEVNSLFTLPNVTIPQAGSAWAREPTQVGDLGFVVPGDAYLGGVSGLGGGTAGLTQQANLSALVFQPVTNKTWVAVDPNAYTLIGPNGVVLRDVDSHSVFTLTPSAVSITSANGTITLSASGHTLTVGPVGVAIDGTTFETHTHSNAGGQGVSGPPVPGS